MTPSHQDRIAAAAMHGGTIFAPIVAPLIALGLFRQRPFVIDHAKRSLKETLVLQAILFTLGIVSLGFTVWSLYAHYQTGWREFSVWPVLAKFAIGWILLLIVSFINAVTALLAAGRALRGEWPKVRSRG